MSTDQDPQRGGSYVRDPETGALLPAPAEPLTETPTDQSAEPGAETKE